MCYTEKESYLNKGIAEAFSYMNIIEAWGSGIPRIIREAKEYGLREPELIEMGYDFRINLFRSEPTFDIHGVIDPRKSIGIRETSSDTNDTNSDTNDTNSDTNDTNSDANDTNFDANNINSDIETVLLQIIQQKPDITQKKIAEQLRISLPTIKRMLSKLQTDGIVLRKGSNRKGEWIVKK